MLEYCPKGDLRSYIIDHETDFKRSLKYYHENGFIPDRLQNSGEVIHHDVRLFCVWACQVDYILKMANSVIKSPYKKIFNILFVQLGCKWHEFSCPKAYSSW